MGLNVQALADFNNQVAGELLVRSVYAGSTMEYITIKEGVKYQEPINLMDVDLVIQNGTCVSTPSGSLEFTQRNITVTPRTSFDGICLKDMDKKYLGISALEPGSYSETFAMAAAYGDLLVNQFQKSNDAYLWNVNNGLRALTSGSAPVNSIGVVIPAAITGSAFTSANALTTIDTMIESLNADVADRDDLTVFMSVANFRKYVSALRTANSFYFDPNSITNRGGILDMMYPFQNVRVVGTSGLTGSDRIILAPAKYIVAGTDLLSDFSEFQMWYDINSDQLKHRISTKLGVQVAYPEYIVSNARA
jgi:hypothetical protein